jgi:hypothetical protein
MEDIFPFLMQFQDLIEIFGSDFYSKVCNLLVFALGSPLVGLIFYIFEALPDLISRSSDFCDDRIQVFFEFDPEINVGMLWREEPEV